MKISNYPRPVIRLYTIGLAALWCLLAMQGALRPARSQSLSDIDRDRGHAMLSEIKNDLKKSYYDASFHGIDVEQRFKAADDMIKRATSLGQVFGIIAQALLSLEDSHTFFLPPAQTAHADYGWQMQAIGDRCYVTAVKPGSDAEAKGLKAGDLIESINGVSPTRENLWKLRYLYYALRPAPGMRLVVQSPNSQRRQLDAMAKVWQDKRRLDFTGGDDIWNIVREAQLEDRLGRHISYEMGDELLIWRMPRFDLTDQRVDAMMDTASKRKALILDLRGNPGGGEETLLRLLGYFFDHDVKVGDMKGRKETKPLTAKTRGDRVFKGKLVVLVNSESGSAAEVLARVIQLEKRGTVIGDRTAGAVMRSRHNHHQMGMDTAIFYGVSITDADLVMTDGKSLERVGVTPDETLLPTAADLAADRDPVLSHAASLAGVKLDAEKAGSLFPIEWRK